MRLIGAISLDAAIYEEVEADRGATGQALTIVVMSSLAAGVGARGLGGLSLANILFISTIGFASTPGLFRIFGIMPGVTVPVFAATAVWMLVATVVAVRQALDYTSTTRAAAVCVLGWSLAIAIAIVLGLLFGPTLS